VESSEAKEQLAAAERGAAAPYVDFPPTPWWYPPVVGAWVAAVIGTFTWWRENAVLFTAVLVALVAAELLFVFWLRRRHGAFPGPGGGTPPAEIAVVRRSFRTALPVIVVLIGLVWWLLGVPAAAGVAFVVVTAGLVRYERRHAEAAARVRERLT
jgi:hypothetical protein